MSALSWWKILDVLSKKDFQLLQCLVGNAAHSLVVHCLKHDETMSGLHTVECAIKDVQLFKITH